MILSYFFEVLFILQVSCIKAFIIRHQASCFAEVQEPTRLLTQLKLCSYDDNKFFCGKHQRVEEDADIDALGFCSCSSSSMLEDDVNRRQLLKSIIASASLQQTLLTATPKISHASEEDSVPILPRGQVFEVQDPNSYSAVVYIPPAPNKTAKKSTSSLPLLVVLHGAGVNQHSALDEFTSPGGDHTNLPPYLLSTQQAPPSLSDNFVVVAPYVGKGKRSIYDEPRSKLLSFIKWFNSYIETQTLADGTHIAINRQKVSLFGFSEGATLAIELATTRQFLGVITASYGFTGSLPRLAIERLQGVPIWAFHSKGDDIYDIQCSGRLIGSLLEYEGGLDVFSVGDIVKYTKLVPLASNEKGREHVRASLVASKDAEVYSWLLSLK